MNASGHFWTIVPWLRGTVAARAVPPWSAVAFDVDDAAWGRVRLSAKLSPAPDSTRLVIVVHGLGGCSESHYAERAARAARAAGMACLRLDLRGADGSGEDLYHAGLASDLAAVIASDAASSYESVFVIGYSLGGHLALGLACGEIDERLAAVAAVCPPLDLARAVDGFDRRASRFYRRHVMSGLWSLYEAIARRRAMPLAPDDARRIRTIREWDEAIVAPRFGFAGADDYYARASVGPRLGSLRVPALLVACDRDPMILAETLRPSLGSPPPGLDVRWVPRGGHCGFPGSLDLGEPGPRGLEPQVLAWLAGRDPRGVGRQSGGSSGA